MTKIENSELVPVENLPEFADAFFSYDRFQFLWYDICDAQKSNLWKPYTKGAFLGIRNLCGEMSDGRKCVANLAFIAEEEELSKLRRIALQILGNYSAFQRCLAGWLSVGGYSYELDIESFNQWLLRCMNATKLKLHALPNSKAVSMLRWMQRTEEAKLEFELLRLAVYTSHWKDIRYFTGDRAVWSLKHPNAVTPKEFENIFETDEQLWELMGEERE